MIICKLVSHQRTTLLQMEHRGSIRTQSHFYSFTVFAKSSILDVWVLEHLRRSVLAIHDYNSAHRSRSSCLKVFCKKGVYRNFAKFTGKQLCQSRFFNNVTLLKKRLCYRCFPVNFAKFPRTPFLTEHLLWLLLSIDSSTYQGVNLCLIKSIDYSVKQY